MFLYRPVSKKKTMKISGFHKKTLRQPKRVIIMICAKIVRSDKNKARKFYSVDILKY